MVPRERVGFPRGWWARHYPRRSLGGGITFTFRAECPGQGSDGAFGDGYGMGRPVRTEKLCSSERGVVTVTASERYGRLIFIGRAGVTLRPVSVLLFYKLFGVTVAGPQCLPGRNCRLAVPRLGGCGGEALSPLAQAQPQPSPGPLIPRLNGCACPEQDQKERRPEQ